MGRVAMILILGDIIVINKGCHVSAIQYVYVIYRSLPEIHTPSSGQVQLAGKNLYLSAPFVGRTLYFFFGRAYIHVINTVNFFSH